MRRTIVLSLIAAVSFIASSAHAVVITFEGFENSIYASPISRSGFSIGNVAGDTQHFHEINSNNAAYGLPSNGTGVLLNDRDSRIFVEDLAAATFALTSVDVATATSNNAAVGIQIEGFLNNVSTGVVSLASLGTGYTTLLGAALGTVDRIVLDGIGGLGGFVFDNLALNAVVGPTVPLPGSLALLVLGLGAFGYQRRKQYQAA